MYKKILLINPFGIGDALFTTPVIKAIKESQPDSIIGYWCNDRIKDILKHNTNIDRIFALARGDIKRIYNQSRLRGMRSSLNLLGNIKKEHFDISLDFSLDHRYSLISKFAGIKRRIGFNYKKRGRFLTDRIDIEGYQDKHVVEYYLDLLEFIDIKTQNPRLELTASEESKRKANYLFESLGINNHDLAIGIAPGAGESWGKDAILKHWPAERFAQLINKIGGDFKAKVLILGNESEKGIADTITNTMDNRAINLVGKTSLEDLIGIIDKLNILITNDGGPLHIAVALGKKTISFFGPVDPKVYGPYPYDDNNHIVLRKSLECSPCYHKFHLNPCNRNKECLQAIDVSQALEAVHKLLS